MNFDKFFETVKETAQYKEGYSVIYPALGLAGETGEAVDIIKKSVRYRTKDEPFSLIDPKGKDRTEDMISELGDVMWYWSNLIIDLGFRPEDIFEYNYNKLRKRYS